ncbi:MAG: hypothetical protein EA402_03515, partial [Planctomycetota bacterium]
LWIGGLTWEHIAHTHSCCPYAMIWVEQYGATRSKKHREFLDGIESFLLKVRNNAQLSPIQDALANESTDKQLPCEYLPLTLRDLRNREGSDPFAESVDIIAKMDQAVTEFAHKIAES